MEQTKREDGAGQDTEVKRMPRKVAAPQIREGEIPSSQKMIHTLVGMKVLNICIYIKLAQNCM